MTASGHKDPLHGVTLQQLLQELVDAYGWDDLARALRMNCFANDPSVNSSLKFLRRTPWARAKVEAMYLWHVKELQRRSSVRRSH